ncbi:hypothetical protein JOQ06_016217 [Pogonophryne albipinna]|uniref:Uncharacterized protein n=1 Tax=Pogonophryne albipinna TaxID=1090488 RepID=A0AAD6FC65_9TELE|nr:hypothetical protein JOQ06_016217 [Pogonophryne albipinna]
MFPISSSRQGRYGRRKLAVQSEQRQQGETISAQTAGGFGGSSAERYQGRPNQLCPRASPRLRPAGALCLASHPDIFTSIPLPSLPIRPCPAQTWQPAGVIRVSAPLARLCARIVCKHQAGTFIPDVAMIRRKGRLFPRGGCSEMETLFCFPKGELLPPSGRHLLVLVGRDSWCCESGRRNPRTGYFPTPGSHPHPSHPHRIDLSLKGLPHCICSLVLDVMMIH